MDVESYNVELKDDEGLLGDRASKGAFRGIIERWRKPLRELGHDPFGEESTDAITKKRLDGLLAAGDPEAAGIVHGAIEEFAQELALVTRRFLKLKGWKDAERIVFGGGFSGSRVGELAIGRASVILKADKIKVEITTIRKRAGRGWSSRGRASCTGVDIPGPRRPPGGRHRRHQHPCRHCRAQSQAAANLPKAEVGRFELWRHGDEKLARDDAVEGLIDMLRRLITRAAKDGLRLAPFIGIGCPGKIEPDGSIDRGAQTCPGIGKAADSISPLRCSKLFPRSESSKHRS